MGKKQNSVGLNIVQEAEKRAQEISINAAVDVGATFPCENYENINETCIDEKNLQGDEIEKNREDKIATLRKRIAARGEYIIVMGEILKKEKKAQECDAGDLYSLLRQKATEAKMPLLRMMLEEKKEEINNV